MDINLLYSIKHQFLIIVLFFLFTIPITADAFFTTDLKLGATNPEVRLLQQYLNNNGYVIAESGPGSKGLETDYFGPATKSALIRYQESFASAILAPAGLNAGTGNFFSGTRAHINNNLNNKPSDPRSVCSNLKSDEVCVCTDDIPVSSCGVEKKLNTTSTNSSTKSSKLTPVITSPLSVSTLVGKTFSYQIRASNKPKSYLATPYLKNNYVVAPGIRINPRTGKLYGKPTIAGTYAINLWAVNSLGVGATSTLVLNVSTTSKSTSRSDSKSSSGSSKSSSGSSSSSPTPTSVSGSCGISNNSTLASTPTTNLCTTGTASSVSGSGPWTWSCAGSNGGTTATCSAGKTVVVSPVPPTTPVVSKPVITSPLTASGIVGKEFSYYITGTNSPTSYSVSYNGSYANFSNATGLSGNGKTGQLYGKPTKAGVYNLNIGASNSAGTGNALLILTVSSSVTVPPTPTPVSGSCGISHNSTIASAPTTNLCTTGTASSVAGSGPWGWTCNGSNGGTTATCSAGKTVVTVPSSPTPSAVRYVGVTSSMWNEIDTQRVAFGDPNNCRVKVSSIPTTGTVLNACSGNCINTALANSNTVILKGGTYSITSMITLDGKKLIGAEGETVIIDAKGVNQAFSVKNSAVLANVRIINAENTGVYVQKMGSLLYKVSVGKTGWNPNVINAGGTGIIVRDAGTTNNCIVSTEVYDGYNEDGNSSTLNGGNADGYVHAWSALNNSFIDAYAYRNSDDGIDFWNGGTGFIYFSNFSENGKTTGKTLTGDGNGVKLGIGTSTHKVYKTQANNNKADGFDINGNKLQPILIGTSAVGNGGRAYFGINSSSILSVPTVSSPTPTPAPTPTPISGICGISNNSTLASTPTTNLCTTGTASNVAGSGPWTWSCAGSNGGTTATCSAGKTVVVSPVPPTTPVVSKPVITSPLTASGKVGVDFSYQMSATNNPTSYAAATPNSDGVWMIGPGGLSGNSSTGLIYGKPAKTGTYNINLKATNSAGTGPISVLVLTVE